MKKILNITKKQVFDGGEKEFNNPLTFFVTHIEINTKISNLINNPLRDALKDSQINLNEILTDDSIQLKTGIIKDYVNNDGLKLYYIIEQGLFIVFSFGEWQQSRYLLNLESAWEIPS